MGEGGLTGTLLLRVMLFFLFSHPPRGPPVVVSTETSAGCTRLGKHTWETRHALRTSGQCGTLNL